MNLVYKNIKILSWVTPLVFASVLTTGAAAQVRPPIAHPAASAPTTVHSDAATRSTSEISMIVAPNVSIKMCVLEGDVRINGWSRSEMRVFVKNGSRLLPKTLEKDPSSNKPVWVMIASAKGREASAGVPADCFSGERVEIDVPFTASLNVTGRTSEITIDSVKRAEVKNIEGNVALRNIAGGISAVTYQGDLTVENSGGAISLESATGNIISYNVTPGQVGDIFKAKTNSGAVSLQNVAHRQIEANSISGSVLFNGGFLPGGQYSFKTSNGAIRLSLPSTSSFQVNASYGFGEFTSDLPLKYQTENNSAAGKSLVGIFGTGDAAVTITTSSGRIGIKTQ